MTTKETVNKFAARLRYLVDELVPARSDYSHGYNLGFRVARDDCRDLIDKVADELAASLPPESAAPSEQEVKEWPDAEGLWSRGGGLYYAKLFNEAKGYEIRNIASVQQFWPRQGWLGAGPPIGGWLPCTVTVPSEPAEQGVDAKQNDSVSYCLMRAADEIKAWAKSMDDAENRKDVEVKPPDLTALGEVATAQLNARGLSGDVAETLVFAKVAIQDHAERVKPALYRKEYCHGVMNGLNDAARLMDLLIKVLSPSPPVAEEPKPPRPSLLAKYDGEWIWLSRLNNRLWYTGSGSVDHHDITEVDRDLSDEAGLAIYDADLSAAKP